MRYVLGKLGQFLLSLWAAVTLNFALPRLMPGSPVDAALAKIASTGQVITQAQRSAIEAQLGLPKTGVLSQYWTYLDGVVHLRFGVSYTYPTEAVTTTIGRALPWTLALVGVATILAFVVGTGIGVAAGWRRGTKWDTGLTLGATFAGAFPPFWLALLLVFFLAYKLQWFPLSGGNTPGLVPDFSALYILDAAKHALLPAITLVVTGLAGWVMGMRNNLINTLGEDYVTFAEANGLRSRTVAVKYAARNALLPNVTGFGLALAGVVGGSVLVEQIFGYPGIGSLLVRAVTNYDFPLMQALFLLITVTTLVAIFLVDMVYVRLDPRVRR